MAVAMVFLILAAQYERWSLPFSVLLALPFGTFGALAAVWLRGLTNATCTSRSGWSRCLAWRRRTRS
jgi:multidrug efflux pump subunit AcrB